MLQTANAALRIASFAKLDLNLPGICAFIVQKISERPVSTHNFRMRFSSLNRQRRLRKQSYSAFAWSSGISVKLIAIATVFLLADSPLRASDNREPLDIRVQIAGFGHASPEDIRLLLQSTALELWRYCPRTHLSGIDVYHRFDHPQTNFIRMPDGRIAIGLAAQDTHWAQYSFQFAHEFCHTLANFSNNSRPSNSSPSSPNYWLEESLCETASLFTLRAMSRSWQAHPPVPAWRDYALWLNDYAAERIAAPEHQLPAGKKFVAWFREHEPALRQNATLWDWNTIVAIQLLPLFEAEPRGWEAVTFLNHRPKNTNESLIAHLAEWRSRCPADLRQFVREVATVFGIGP
jgi:hypothetical protein